jgi:2-furoyl-CoA dehydrogenase FAD binding subunit
MKAPPFAYVRPATVADAVAELARAGDDGKVLAGGQSLVPVLAMRLGRPAVLVDINAVTGLDELSVSDDSVYAGATVRQRQVEQHRAAAAVPLLAMAMPWIGHRELRGRGTVCGSLAHADPAAELPAVAACLNATLDVAGPGGRRTVGAREFFTGPMSTVLAPDELLLGARFPVAGPEDGFGFTELARRHGDFALTGVAIHVRRSPSGEVLSATLAAFGVSGRPVVRDVTPALASCLDAPGEPATELARALAAPM